MTADSLSAASRSKVFIAFEYAGFSCRNNNKDREGRRLQGKLALPAARETVFRRLFSCSSREFFLTRQTQIFLKHCSIFHYQQKT